MTPPLGLDLHFMGQALRNTWTGWATDRPTEANLANYMFMTHDFFASSPPFLGLSYKHWGTHNTKQDLL